MASGWMATIDSAFRQALARPVWNARVAANNAAGCRSTTFSSLSVLGPSAARRGSRKTQYSPENSRQRSLRAARRFILGRKIRMAGEMPMSKFKTALLAGGIFAALVCAGATWAADNVPDLMAGGNGWNSAGGM